jgi:PAS domain-containing protein
MDHDDQSIYPDFFKIGIGKLGGPGASGADLVGLFSALQHFQRDLKEKEGVPDILRVAHLYLSGLGIFQTSAFYLIDPSTMAFERAGFTPNDSAQLDQIVREEMRAGRFAWALRQSAPVFFNVRNGPQPVRGMFHTLSIATHTIGMFCGLLLHERAPSQEIAFSLLSILLGACADALAVARNTAELQQKILAVNHDLRKALEENEILARLPAESPSPIVRIRRDGRILYANLVGQSVLRDLGFEPGDVLNGQWREFLDRAFASGEKLDFETTLGGRGFAFLVAVVPETGYANFYGTDITARQQAEQARQRVIQKLQEALDRVKTLSGLLPICASCKKIRNDRGYWDHVDHYLQCHTEVTFSHGICPDCLRKLYPEYAESIINATAPFRK